MGITNLLYIPTYVPVLVFVFLLLGAITYGALAGWKRAAYWGGSAIVWLFFGWILFACTKGPIADAIINKIGSSFGDFDVHGVMVYAITSVISIFFYMIVILIGTVCVSVPLWYTLFRRRILHIYSEKYAAKHKIKVEKRSTKYKLINALIGASGMAILFLPIISDVTSMTMVVSTDYHVLNSNIKDDPWTNKKGHPSKSTQGFLKGINNLSKLPLYANDTLMLTTTMNGIFELMSKPSELNSSVLNTYTDSLKNLFDFDTSIDGSHIIVDTIQSIVDELTTKINGPISSSTPNILPYNDAVNWTRTPFQNVVINNNIIKHAAELLDNLFKNDSAEQSKIESAVSIFAITTNSADVHTVIQSEWENMSRDIETECGGDASPILGNIGQYYFGGSSPISWSDFNHMMEDRIIENQIKLLPNSGNNFNYKYLAEGTHQLDTATCEITLGVEDPNPTYVPATPHLYLPACISSSDINISPIGMPTKVLSEMSKIIHMDGDEARANQLARKFASYFYTDKNPNGNNWSIKDI